MFEKNSFENKGEVREDKEETTGALDEQTDEERAEITANVLEQIDPVEKPADTVVPDGPDAEGHTYRGNPHAFDEDRAA